MNDNEKKFIEERLYALSFYIENLKRILLKEHSLDISNHIDQLKIPLLQISTLVLGINSQEDLNNFVLNVRDEISSLKAKGQFCKNCSHSELNHAHKNCDYKNVAEVCNCGDFKN